MLSVSRIPGMLVSIWIESVILCTIAWTGNDILTLFPYPIDDLEEVKIRLNRTVFEDLQLNPIGCIVPGYSNCHSHTNIRGNLLILIISICKFEFVIKLHLFF